MINKYAEINDRVLLYNACKGILRVKMAAKGAKSSSKSKAKPDASFSQYKNISRPMLGTLLAMGVNGVEGDIPDDADLEAYNNAKLAPTTWKSRGRQALALGSIGLGTVGGGAGGYYLGKGISKLTGLANSDNGFARAADIGLRSLGAVGGGLVGLGAGTHLAGSLAGGSEEDARRAYQVVLDNADNDGPLADARVGYTTVRRIKPW